MRRFSIILVLLLVGCLLIPRPAESHGYILRSIPQDRAVLDHAPSRIQVWFSEGLEAQFSMITLTDQHGATIPLTESGVLPAHTEQITARLPPNLPDGAYLVTLRIAFASDGHVDTQTMVFWVGHQTDTIAAQLASQSANPAEIGWRILTFIALNLLFGTLVLYQVVLLPGWGTKRYAAGNLPPRLMHRLSTLIWIGLIMAFVGGIYALLQQSAVLFSTNVLGVLQNRNWQIVLNGTQFGDVLKLRLLLLTLALIFHAISVYYAPQQPAVVGPFWAINLIIVGAALGSISIGSHAAGATLWTPLAIGVDYIHLLMNATWAGGLVALVFVLPVAIKPLPESEGHTATLAVLRRFSILGGIAVLTLIVTGIFSALEYVRQPGDLPDTNYGRTLLVKMLLIAPLLLIALYHHGLASQDRLARWVRRFSARIEHFNTSLRLEVLLGIGVIVAASVLTASPPPIPPDARANAAPPSQTQTINGMQITLAVDPNGPGANSYTITLSRDKQPIIGAQIRLRFVYPSLDRRSALLTLDDAGDGSYTSAGQELDRAGSWDALLDVIPAGATYDPQFRAAFVWNLPEIPPNTTTRQPTLLNWLSVLGLVLVAGIIIRPSANRAMQALKLQPESLVVAVVVVAITVILTVVGGAYMQQASQQTDALRNQPPAVVNPVLANADSLASGKTIYDTRCAACHGTSGAGSAAVQTDLGNRLSTRRDEELFRLIQGGDYHKSLRNLSDTQRWNVINYLRAPVFAR